MHPESSAIINTIQLTDNTDIFFSCSIAWTLLYDVPAARNDSTLYHMIMTLTLDSKTLCVIHYRLDERAALAIMTHHALAKPPSHLVAGIALHQRIAQRGLLIPFQTQRHAITVAIYNEDSPTHLIVLREIYSAPHIAHLMRWRSLTGRHAHISSMPMKLITRDDDTSQGFTLQLDQHEPLHVMMTAPCYIKPTHHDTFIHASSRRDASSQRVLHQKSKPVASWTVQSHRLDALATILLPHMELLDSPSIEHVHSYHAPTILLSTSDPS